jgi:hypothetical protein
MKAFAQFVLLAVFGCLLSGCLFKEPVFTEGFVKTNPAIGGAWVADSENGDPRKMEFALCAPLDHDRYVLHYPSGGKDGIYYEARPLQVRDRSLLQLRVLATFANGLPKPGADCYTLLWLDQNPAQRTLQVRALGEDGVKEKSPVAVRKLLEDPASDWSKLFGEPMTFRQLKDE